VDRPEPEVGQDLLDDFGLLDESDDPHWSRTPGTDERVHLVDLFDEPRPRALRGRGRDLVDFLNVLRDVVDSADFF